VRAMAAAILLVTLTACPGKGTHSALPTGSTPAGVSGGTLHVGLTEDVDAIDPQRAGQPASFTLARAMHRGLMAFPAAVAPDGAQPVPDLADGLPGVSPDGLRYIFHLRPGVAFGPPASRPLVAGDVKAGLERIFTASSPMAGYYRIIAGADALVAGRASGLSGVETPDDRTVVVSLVRPANDLLWLLSLPAASAVPPGLSATARPAEISPSGPYRLAADDGYVPEHGIHLVRNEAWVPSSDPVRHAWVDEVRYEVGLSTAEIGARLLDGRVDLLADRLPPGTPPAAVPPDQIVRAPNGCLRYLFMNARVAPFSNGRVRAAVATALDRGGVAATYGSGATPAATILPPTVDGYDASRSAPAPDPAAARERLAAAGFAHGFTTRLVVGDQATDVLQAGLVRAALAKAGVHVAISIVPIALLFEDHYEVPGAGTPMGIATWCADWPGLAGRGALEPLVDGRGFRARGNTNYSGVNDPSLDAAMDAAAKVADPVQAGAAWLDCDRRAAALFAVVPLAQLVEESALSVRVRGFVPHPFYVRGDPTALWLAP